LGFDEEELDLTGLLIALASELASFSSCVEVGVSSFSGSGCMGPSCTKGCTENISANSSDAGWMTGVEVPDESRKVKSF